MSAFFVDTSALAKRYIAEPASAWVIEWIVPDSGHTIVVSELATVEIFSLLSRRQREGSLTGEHLSALQAVFLLHMEQEYLVTPVDRALLKHASQLVTRHPLRTLDAIHLASAHFAASILNGPMRFVSGDKTLLAAAAAEGFATDNPNDHL